MEFRKLGNTEIDVSLICLGTMTWGQQNTEQEGHEQMDYAIDQGINFFDTAELYAIPPKAETQGKTEEIIGTWFKKTGNREKVIIASKVAGRSGMKWFRGGETRLDRKNIEKAIEGSLKRLQTDYIDLYQLHWPDRPLNLFGGGSGGVYKHYEMDSINIEETLEILSELVKTGKVRSIGLSNETPWGLSEFINKSEKLDFPKVQSVQNAYNLLNRTYEYGMSEFAHRSSVGLLAYSPLAQGYLSGKYLNGAMPKGSRTELFGRGQRYETPSAEKSIKAYVEYAKEINLDPSVMANAFVNSREFVTSNIIGATTMEQLKLAIGSWEIKLSEEDLKEIDKIHSACPNPCP
jgi:aryl-alcohol dehydrogenase-like predicted oxidoreductase|tara:strand:- start:2420 stop:3463 length:1044 start_codon:yes stop_codon:yes gene_type:complete